MASSDTWTKLKNKIIMVAGKLSFRRFWKRELCFTWNISRKQNYTQMAELKRFNEGTFCTKRGQVKVTNEGS